MNNRKRTKEPLKNEWRRLYESLKGILQEFGEDDCGGGDYFLYNAVPNEPVQWLELHKLHMLRPNIINRLQRVLVDYADWQIEVFVISPDEKTIISPESGLILRRDGIIDALDRSLLPKKYQGLVFDGSRRPPKNFKL